MKFNDFSQFIENKNDKEVYEELFKYFSSSFENIKIKIKLENDEL